jgi:hypothetical protein
MPRSGADLLLNVHKTPSRKEGMAWFSSRPLPSLWWYTYNCFVSSVVLHAIVQDNSSVSYILYNVHYAVYSVECNCFLNSALFVQDKNKALDDTPPFFDLSSLKSRTFQIILLSTFVSSFGIFTPLLLLVSKHLKGQYNIYAGNG